jgi:hypothetical protein
VRASNLQEAVSFARRWNLHGVVMSSEPFVMSPKLMAYVKDARLICMSFGFLNNDAENAKVLNIIHCYIVHPLLKPCFAHTTISSRYNSAISMQSSLTM